MSRTNIVKGPTHAVVWGTTGTEEIEWHFTFGDAKAKSLALAAEGYAVTVLEIVGTAHEAKATFIATVRK